MKEARGPILLALLVALALVAAAVFGVVRAEKDRAEAPGVPANLVPASWSEFRTSAGHKAHIGKKDVTCKDCHAFERDGFKNPGSALCTRGHADQTSHAHGGGRADVGHGKECLSCHAFAPDKEAPTCMSCHREAADHVRAVGVHATTKCTECHTPHGAKTAEATSKDCTSCHDERSTKHAEHAGSKACVDCHAPHTEAKEAKATCGGCHATPAGPKPAGHDSCLTCHKPHDFLGVAADAGPPSTSIPAEPRLPPGLHAPGPAQGVRASACASCHAPKPTLASMKAPEHTICTNCHTPHAPKASAPGACQNCHLQVHVGHGTKGPEACVSCHAPHASDPNRFAAACTSCHTKIGASDTAAHGGKTACTACHATHDFKAPKGTAKGALCATCHAAEVSRTASSKGHKACDSCHGATTHKPAAAPACASCHTKEASSAPKGHAACANCHETHSGSIPKPGACSSCHKAEAATKHGSAVSGGCATCHRPHGPSGVASPPACASCHERPKLPGLHAISDHATCNNCHQAHGPPKADRASCTTQCHTDRTQHQPQAQVCNGCHVFRK